MQWNLQYVVAHATKHINGVVEDAALAPSTAKQAWTLSSERNEKLAKEQQAAALKSLFK